MLSKLRQAARRKNNPGGDEDQDQDERDEENGVELGDRETRNRKRAEGKDQDDEEEDKDGEEDGLLDRDSPRAEGKDEEDDEPVSPGKKSMLSRFTRNRSKPKAKKSSDGDGDDEEKGDDEGGDGDEDGGDGTRKSSPKKSMLSRFKRGRKDREDAIEEKKGDDEEEEDGEEGEDGRGADDEDAKSRKKAKAKARQRERERKRREAKAKAESQTSYKPTQTFAQWCCNAANMLSLNAYITCVVAVFGCQILCVLEGQCHDKTNNPAVQTLTNWFALPLVALVLFNGLVGLQAAESMRTIEKLRKSNAENHDVAPVPLFGHRMIVRVFAIFSIVTAFVLFIITSALFAELTTGEIRRRVTRKWENGVYGTKATTFYEDPDALADEKIEYTGHTFMFSFFGMVIQGLAAVKTTYFMVKDHCCSSVPSFRGSSRGGAAAEEEEET